MKQSAICWLCGHTFSGEAEAKLATTIEDLKLPTRVQHCLQRYGIKTVRELVELTLNDLLRMRGFGPKCAQELNERVVAFGLRGWEII
jgi:DNA-directed RNA polymerase alpha subunit